FVDLGVRILERELPRHCSEDGTFREGSAHYQWVITRWMVEAAMALRSHGHRFAGPLIVRVLPMLDVCDCLSTGEGVSQSIVRIGDLSPDFPPEWYVGLTAVARRCFGAALSDMPTFEVHGWARLFAMQAPAAPRPVSAW